MNSAPTSVNAFSVSDWHAQDEAMSVYLIDASGSTSERFREVDEPDPDEDAGKGKRCGRGVRSKPQTVLAFEKSLLTRTAKAVAPNARQLVVILRDRCPLCGPSKVFCECAAPECEAYTVADQADCLFPS